IGHREQSKDFSRSATRRQKEILDRVTKESPRADTQGPNDRSLLMTSYLKTSRQVNSRGAGRQSLGDLEARIREVRRAAAHQHLDESEWRAVDRMRHHVARRSKEGS